MYSLQHFGEFRFQSSGGVGHEGEPNSESQPKSLPEKNRQDPRTQTYGTGDRGVGSVDCGPTQVVLQHDFILY